MNRIVVFAMSLVLGLSLAGCEADLFISFDPDQDRPETQPMLRLYGTEDDLLALDIDTLPDGFLMLAQIRTDIESESEEEDNDELNLLLVQTDDQGLINSPHQMQRLGQGDSLRSGVDLLRIGTAGWWALANRTSASQERPYLLPLSTSLIPATPIGLPHLRPGEDYHLQAALYDSDQQAVLLAGYTTFLDSPKSNAPPLVADPFDLWLCQIATDGSLHWERRYGFNGADRALALYPTDRGYLVMGQTQYPADDIEDQDIILLHVNSQGDLIDQRTLTESGREEVPVAMVEKPEGGWWLLFNAFSGASNRRMGLYEIAADLSPGPSSDLITGEATDLLARPGRLYAWSSVNSAQAALQLQVFQGGDWNPRLARRYGYPSQNDRSARMAPTRQNGLALLATLGWDNAERIMALTLVPSDSLPN